MSQPFIHIRTNVGKAVHLNGSTIVPIARSVHIRLPLLSGGLIWNRPIAVLVRPDRVHPAGTRCDATPAAVCAGCRCAGVCVALASSTP